MAAYNKTNVLFPVDATYIAGLIDGEGTVTMSRKHKNDNRQLVISISNTESPLLEYVLEKAGAGKITRKKIYKENHTPSMTYTISNRQALDLLTQITPYLQTYKKQRAQLILENYIRVTPRNGKYTESLALEREIFIREFFDIHP